MKQLSKTKVTVRLRKVVAQKEWYIYLESYPVFVTGKSKPQRIREYLNRSVTTVQWNKKRTARTTSDGVKTFKPKRDDNGVIACRSEVDCESMLYADGVRKLRQREYDNIDLYSDTETAHVKQKERLQHSFIQYFEKVTFKRHANSSKSIQVNWQRANDFLKLFTNNTLLFSQIDIALVESFKLFLLSAPMGGNKKGIISRNTASTYFAIFKAALKQAFIDGYLENDLSAKVKGIQENETRREYLTVEELSILATTPCVCPVLKRAALFSALTGLRHIDIKNLKWSEISLEGNQPRLNFTQQKTKGVEYMPISEQALLLCGEPCEKEQIVFEGLPDPSWISRPLKGWIEAAGIKKKITFHCFRHTFATLQLSNGTDIYTVSKMLGHTDIKTTQIYAKVVDEMKNRAAKAIIIDKLYDIDLK